MEIAPFIEQSSGLSGFRFTTSTASKEPDKNARKFVSDWVRKNRSYVMKLTQESPALLFRNFPITTTRQFENFVLDLDFIPFGEYADLPKDEGAEQIYKSTPFPNNKPILFHNESSHLNQWPHYQFFYCSTPSIKGGATPLVDCRKIIDLLPKGLVEQFETKKLMYIRTFKQYLDTSWQNFFMTKDRDAVAEKCEALGYEHCWLENDELQIRSFSPGVITHPFTNEKVFFNQVQLHHGFFLNPNVRASMLDMFGADKMPRDVCYGDGSAIAESDMAKIAAAYDELALRFTWQRNDIVMLDNMLTAHGRDPFEGDRKISVAMSNMVSSHSF